MFPALKRNISRHFTNILGWRTNRKIVVIESDDWGSIRMPSKEVYKQCLKAGYQVDRIAYERFDSLASEDDLEFLFELLSHYKDQNGNPTVMTANILAANPDFEKIASAGFQEYFYELVTETFQRYPKHSDCFDLWKKGKEEGVFYPQSHGREHLNVSMFMNALQGGDEDVLFGFEHKMPGSMPKGRAGVGNILVESLRCNNQQDKKKKLDIILEVLDIYETLMEYRSEAFITANYLWSPDYNASLVTADVRFSQRRRKLKEPRFDGIIRLNSYRS